MPITYLDEKPAPKVINGAPNRKITYLDEPPPKTPYQSRDENAPMRTAAAGLVGTMPAPEDIVGMMVKLVNGMSQGTVERNLKFPAGGGALAEGANMPHDISQIVSDFTGGKTPVAPQVIKPSGAEKILPQPVTPGGKIAGQMLEAGGYAMGPEAFSKAASIKKPIAPYQALQKAEKLTTEILQPSKGDLQSYMERGKKFPPTEVAAKYIKESKNYGELQERLQSVINGKLEERNFLIKRFNRPIGKTYLQDLQKYITEQRRSGQIPDSELKVMREVLEKEAKWASRQRKLNTVKAETRKEELQQMTESLLDRRADGTNVSRDPARSRALDVLRRGLKEKIEMSHPQIKKNNALYGALSEAKSLVAGQRALAEKEVPMRTMEKILSFFGKGAKDVPMAIARRVAGNEKHLSKVTAEIERLRKIAG